MQPYNPGEPDRSGQIAAQNNLLAAQGISSGISQAGQGISQALQMLATKNQDTKSADGTAALAHDLGMMDDTAYHNYTSLGRDERVGSMKQFGTLLNIQQTAQFKNALLALKQQGLDQAGAKAAGGSKGMGISPWSGSAVPGAFTSGGATLDDQ